MKDQSQNNNIQNDEDGKCIWRGDRKFYLKNEGSNWLDSEEVNKIIRLYYKKEPVEVPPDTQDEQIKLFIELFPNQNISLSTLTLDNKNYKFYIFTDGAFFGYAFLIDDKFAHIDYTPKNLSNFIADNNKYATENLLLQKNTINHNDSCGLGTATDICEIIDKINNKTDNSQILQWLKSKTPNQERKLKVGEQGFSTNLWNLNIKNNLVELLYQDPEPTIDIIAQSQKAEELPINNNKSAQDINNEIIENLKAHYIQLFKEDGEVIFNEVKQGDKTTEKTEDKIERLCTFISSIVKQQKDIEKELKEKSNNQIIIKSDNRLLDYQGFEVVICDKKSTTIERQKPKILDSVIPDIKKDIDYAFCQKNNTNNFGFRFNSEAGELINAVNKEGASDAEKNTAWKKLLTEHDTVIFKLALDKQNYIRFYLNRDKDGKIEFASDEFLFSKADALELSKDFAQYDKIKKNSTSKISDNERFDIHLYCKSGKEEKDADIEILKAEFDAQKPQNKITNTRIENKNLKQL